MEIAQLEAFTRIAREGNFTRAAEALHLTQPAISARIAALELELGGTLFDRQGRTLTLTPLGKHFLPYAERMLALMADSLQSARQFRQGKRGEVKIAAPTPFILSFLPEVLEAFRQQHPAVDILIRERHKTTVLEMLRDNTMLLGLVNAPVLDTQIRHLLSWRDPICAVVAPHHPLATVPAPIPLMHIYQHTIFRVSMSPEMSHFMDELAEHGRQGSGGAVIAVPMSLALRLVLLGQGLSFLPASYIQPALTSGELVLLTIENVPRLYNQPVLIAHKERTLDSVHQAFVQILEARWQHLKIE